MGYEIRDTVRSRNWFWTRHRRTIIAGVGTLILTQTTPVEPQAIYALPTATLADAELVVAPYGNDGAAGTVQAPLLTIDAAARRARPGDTVLVRTGTYTGDVNTDARGTASARIAYVAESPNVKIVGSNGQAGVWENHGDYVDIVGFEITGPNKNGLFNRGSHVRIMRNRMHGIRGNCIYTWDNDYSLTDIHVIGNVTSDCGEDALDHGIYVTHRRGTVANNISYSGPGFGIQCWHACNSIVIVNNLVFYNRQGGIVIGADDNEYEVSNCLVANNIAVANGRQGIRESGESGRGNRFVNNLLWNNDLDTILLNAGEEQGAIVADPQFVNFGSGKYRVQPTSPVVDTGTPYMAPPVAIDRAPRPQSRGFDVGPYER